MSVVNSVNIKGLLNTGTNGHLGDDKIFLAINSYSGVWPTTKLEHHNL